MMQFHLTERMPATSKTSCTENYFDKDYLACNGKYCFVPVIYTQWGSKNRQILTIGERVKENIIVKISCDFQGLLMNMKIC